MWLLILVVAVAGGLMFLVGRAKDDDSEPIVTDVGDRGLTTDHVEIPWGSVYRVELIVRPGRRETRFGFRIGSEVGGPVIVPGSAGLGEQFLARCHLLPGFDHDAVRVALTAGKATIVCYNR